MQRFKLVGPARMVFLFPGFFSFLAAILCLCQIILYEVKKIDTTVRCKYTTIYI